MGENLIGKRIDLLDIIESAIGYHSCNYNHKPNVCILSPDLYNWFENNLSNDVKLWGGKLLILDMDVYMSPNLKDFECKVY